MAEPDFLLLTVTDLRAGREAELDRLIVSVAAFLEDHPGVRLEHLVLVQNASAAALLGPPAPFVNLFAQEGLLPSSPARNRLLSLAEERGLIGDETIVAFPDDDAWYPDGTLAHLAEAFKADDTLDLWLTRYGLDCSCPSPVQSIAPSLQEAISASCCNTLVLRGRLLKRIGCYDPQLGLGVPANGGEDTDLGMRAFGSARSVRLARERLVGHRDMNPALRRKYYPGSLMAIARNSGLGIAGRIALLRKLAIGVHMILRGRLSLREFFMSLRMAWAFRRAPCPMLESARSTGET